MVIYQKRTHRVRSLGLKDVQKEGAGGRVQNLRGLFSLRIHRVIPPAIKDQKIKIRCHSSIRAPPQAPACSGSDR